MRSILAAFLVVACATTPIEPPDQKVAGCWIDRGQNRTVTMRWLRSDEGLRGDLLEYGRTGNVGRRAHYSLAQEGQAWELCERLDMGMPGRCWQVAEGESGSLEGGRIFIDRHREELRIAVVGGPDDSEVIFDGDVDGCD